MKAEERDQLAEEFLLFIGIMMRGMGAVFRREMEACQVTWPQFHLLKVVKHSDRPTVTELSNSLMIAAPTASRMINGLCCKGLLSKEKDAGDHRVTIVVLTPESEELLTSLRALQAKVIAQVFEGEDPEEMRRDVKSLSRIARKWWIAGEKEAMEGVADER